MRRSPRSPTNSSAGDLVIDGGNSRYTEDGPHAKLLGDKGIAFIDAGVSGGVWGLKEGYGLMVGGSDADVERAMPIFDTLRPPGPREDGFVHAGPVGAGHFAKMVHNGIEYALMTAYAEGYEMLAAEDLIKDPQAVYQAWTNGTVVRSWLQQLLAKALKEDPELEEITGYTEDSGEGRWTVEEAIRLRVPVPGDRRVAVRPVPVPAGRLADDEGGRRRCATSSVATRSRGSASRDRLPLARSELGVRPPSGIAGLPVLAAGRPGPGTRAARCSSGPTGSARRISLRHCGIRRHLDHTGWPRTHR